MVREHVAKLWSRRRNQKGMDYAKGRAITGKFDLGQIVAMSVRKFSIARLRYLPLDKSPRRRVQRRISVHLIGIRSNASY
jgi:hypothetical protein